MKFDIQDLLREYSGPPFVLVCDALKRLSEAGGDPKKLSLEDQDVLIYAHRAGHFDPPVLEP